MRRRIERDMSGFVRRQIAALVGQERVRKFVKGRAEKKHEVPDEQAGKHFSHMRPSCTPNLTQVASPPWLLDVTRCFRCSSPCSPPAAARIPAWSRCAPAAAPGR